MFILFNGKIIRREEWLPNALLLGKPFLLEETVWFASGALPLFRNHLELLEARCQQLNLPPPKELAHPQELHRLSTRLINKNKAFMGGWLHYSFFRNAERYDSLVVCRPCPTREFPMEAAGLLATISGEVKFSRTPAASFLVSSKLLWESERLRLAGSRYSEAVFCNEQGVVTEATGGNIFCLTGNSLVTPATETGCVADPLRQVVLQAAVAAGLQVLESAKISPQELSQMEEIFIASEAEGVRWILGVGAKRFVKNKTEILYRQLDRLLTEKIS